MKNISSQKSYQRYQREKGKAVASRKTQVESLLAQFQQDQNKNERKFVKKIPLKKDGGFKMKGLNSFQTIT